jgi:hypothetical protein
MSDKPLVGPVPPVSFSHVTQPALKTVCCLCQAVIVDGSPSPISHGICPNCLPGALKDAEQP